MNRHTNIQIINGIDGAPAFVVVPYAEWIAQRDRDRAGVPHEVVNLVFDNNWTPMRAWREYLALTQTEVARRIGVSQAAYAQSEGAAKPRKSTLQKIATAMNLTLEQIDF